MTAHTHRDEALQKRQRKETKLRKRLGGELRANKMSWEEPWDAGDGTDEEERAGFGS